MGSEVYQAQVLRAFFDAVTGTDRNLTRIYMCVITLAKLRNESPEKLVFLKNQMDESRKQKTLSIDIIEYMAEVANSLDSWAGQTVFGVTAPVKSDDFGGISLDSF